jgi:hypothetical protein
MKELLNKDQEKAEPDKVEQKTVPGWKGILGMLYILSGNLLMTASYTLTKILLRSSDRYTSFEIFAGRTIAQMICQETYYKCLQRKSKQEQEKSTENAKQKLMTYS